MTIQIFPHGDKTKAEIIGEANIINTLTNRRRPEFGDYEVEVFSHSKPMKFKLRNHRRADGFWPLIKQIAEKMIA